MSAGFLLLFPLIIALGSGEDVAPGQPIIGDLVLLAQTESNPTVEISVEEMDETTWKLVSLVANEKEIMVKVRADTPWQLIVTDENTLTAGHMTEWTGLSYTNLRLISPMKVVGSVEVDLPNQENTPIQMGVATSSTDEPLQVKLLQEVSLNDEPLAAGNIYHIELKITLALE
jgi:hypothetical protein